jgi:ATP-dependent Clp protease ATP-binding subunit ClpA
VSLQIPPGIDGAAPPPATGAMPFSQSAIDVLRRALQEALQFGHNYIGTEHLLLALFAGGSGTRASAILEGFGATYGDFKDRVVQKLEALRP